MPGSYLIVERVTLTLAGNFVTSENEIVRQMILIGLTSFGG